LAKRRTPSQKNGATVSAEFRRFDDARRYELGVEAICQLAAEVVALRVKTREAKAGADLIDRYWGIIYAVSAESLPLASNFKVTKDMLVWMCLTRAISWMKNLVRVHSKSRWEEVQEMIVAWQDAWGNDARAQYAQAKFTTLSGIVRGANEEHQSYMHTALIKALSDVQA
jgi:CO dehydrogenase/acetyl-CoA synthase gamma subunit (corrinoid Fe-S protein)